MGKGGSGYREGKDAAMPEDAPLNGGAPDAGLKGLAGVSEMQAKLHRWAVADPGRRFDDLFNFVYDPATLIVAFDRVAGNPGRARPESTALRSPISRRIGGARVLGRSANRSENRLVSAVAGQGTQDPQAWRVGKGPQARYSDGCRKVRHGPGKCWVGCW